MRQRDLELKTVIAAAYEQGISIALVPLIGKGPLAALVPTF